MRAPAGLGTAGERRVVSNKIEERRRGGDHIGVVAWSRVAEKLSQPIDSIKPNFQKRPQAPSVRRGAPDVGRRGGVSINRVISMS
jgi:hypothetical protein